jgi:predicted  nucleic acid-binding Zn-ribbon protein
VKFLYAAGKLLKARPFLAACLILLTGLLWYREQYHDERTAALELAAKQQAAVNQAQEIAAERRLAFYNEQQERLEQRNQELINRNKLEQAALVETGRIYEAANEIIEHQFKKIDELKAEHEALRHRVPDNAISLFEQPRSNHHDVS